MRTTLLCSGELTPADLDRWRELAAAAAEPNPFYEPDYVLPLARALGEQEEILLAVVQDEGGWLACVPVRHVARWHRIPLRALASWRGRGLLPALLGTPLVAREHLAPATAALLRGLAGSPGSWFATLDGVVADGPVYGALRAGLASEGLWGHVFAREDRAFVSRHGQDDYVQTAMQKKHLRNLRGQSRRLVEELGDELELLDRTGQDGAVAQLVELEAASHLAERGEVIAADPAIEGFFTEMCDRFAARDRLQLLALNAGGRTVAVKCNLLADPGVFYLKIAYDETLQKFSPGIQMEAAAFSLFHGRAQSMWIDSCASPENKMANRLFPERRTLETVVFAQRSPRLLLAAPAVRLAQRLRDRAMRAR
ncbi:MAG: hypothetical protein JWM60_1420 [Solirubrobacterales bacterium]|nr:hypothetical protein [Solirubrobacterales bacterium]